MPRKPGKKPAVSLAELIEGNEDLLTEILIRLPVVPLVRFRLVSTRWRGIISSPNFRLLHSRTHKPSPSGVYVPHPIARISSICLSGESTMLPPPSKPHVVCSGNGLLLCKHRLRTQRAHRSCAMFVYNPLTNEAKSFPEPSHSHDSRFYLINDPLNSTDFQVVCITSLGMDDCTFSIYSSSTGEWGVASLLRSPAGFSSQGILAALVCEGVLWNGAIHWAGRDLVLHYLDINSKEIVRVDMSPRPTWLIKYRHYFGEWRGHLHLIEVERYYDTIFDILELDQDSFKWYVKYRVDLDPVSSAFPEIRMWSPFIGGQIFDVISDQKFLPFSILALVRGEKEVDPVLVLAIRAKVISYNFVSGTVELLWNCPRLRPVHSLKAYHYAGSFAPL